jgi:hypothetical protein
MGEYQSGIKRFLKMFGLSVLGFGGLGLLMRYGNFILGGSGGLFILVFVLAMVGIYLYINN